MFDSSRLQAPIRGKYNNKQANIALLVKIFIVVPIDTVEYIYNVSADFSLIFCYYRF